LRGAYGNNKLTSSSQH